MTAAVEQVAAPRVALVHDWLTGMRGGEKVLARLASRFPGAPIFTLFRFPGTVETTLESREVRTSFLQRAPGLRRWYRHYLPLFPAAIEDLDLAAFDLVVSSSHCVAKGVLPAPGAFHVCYCHTPMRYAWDQERAYFPRRQGLVARARGLALARLRTWDVASAARVDLFLANSTFVAERIRRYYRRRAQVLPPPVDVDFFTPGNDGATRHHDGYILSVAALSPYKQHEIAIEAATITGSRLRIVGDGPLRPELERRSDGRVELLGRVEGEKLRALYRGADAFVQPAVEDFGIAAVEALACGVPVIAAGRGGVTDIVEDGRHGVLYHPATGAKGLAGAIDRCRQKRFNSLDLRSRAEHFSRQRFDERFQSVLEKRLPIRLRRLLEPGGGAGP
ncbi:MAG TPA: glycosyltransferase [Thermoanaerobaculia bacterium]|nr:glycosyltransferase [Thermoanaerobaculia bacterium]